MKHKPGVISNLLRGTWGERCLVHITVLQRAKHRLFLSDFIQQM